MAEPTVIQAALSALQEALKDGSVVVLGEDVASGGPFGLTKGLWEEFGSKQVRNTPISEASFMGVGIGIALAGFRPFVDIMFNDFITVASDQLFNHAAKIHYMSGGQTELPLTVWTVAGGGSRWGAQHSQHLEGWFTQIPGLKVLSPASPAMTYQAVLSAIADPDPVVLLVDRFLLYSKQGLPGDDGSPWYPRKITEGRGVSVVATGRLVHMALEAARRANIDAEIIDLQRLTPIPTEIICESVTKTARLVILSDEVRDGGFVSLLASRIYEDTFWSMDGPIISVTSQNTPPPSGALLEDNFMITVDSITEAMEQSARS